MQFHCETMSVYLYIYSKFILTLTLLRLYPLERTKAPFTSIYFELLLYKLTDLVFITYSCFLQNSWERRLGILCECIKSLFSDIYIELLLSNNWRNGMKPGHGDNIHFPENYRVGQLVYYMTKVLIEIIGRSEKS